MDDEKRDAPAKPDSTDPNSRPREESIAQSEAGLPDDSGKPVDIDEGEAKAIEGKIRSL
ncbi:hypothetical protein [Methylobacterium iners]|uniref:Nucleotide exchange factor GrpE n=1 Tax=Methylobacterium iners TaxID=418707 RepID=A0ABQ4S0Y9_9HYPH|nr:hypothetical protein [Methylobacterium iners]GJD96744.1 hypothetical protein OCOJLMKI_3969 [Methylobacterium iners]